jgi:hypothetical protein
MDAQRMMARAFIVCIGVIEERAFEEGMSYLPRTHCARASNAWKRVGLYVEALSLLAFSGPRHHRSQRRGDQLSSGRTRQL